MADPIDDLIAAMRSDPRVREEIRRAALTDDLLELPARVERLEQGLDDVRATLHQMVDVLAQQQTTLLHQQATMGQQQATMAQQQATLLQLEDVVASILRVQQQNTDDLAALLRAVGHLSDRVGWLEGWVLEERYRNRAFAYFQRIAKGIHGLAPDEIQELLASAVSGGQIAEDEADEVRLADVLARGRRNGEEVWLVVEVSHTVDAHDVDRAASRAAIVARTGRVTLAVVAGTRTTVDADEAIRDRGVWRVVNGRVDPPPVR